MAKILVLLLKVCISIKFIFPLTEKWAVSTGFNFQNNIDVNDPDFRLGYKYIWRVDYAGEMKYLLTNQWFLTASVNFNLRNIPDLYFLNDPKFSFLIGIEKPFLKKEKQKNKL